MDRCDVAVVAADRQAGRPPGKQAGSRCLHAEMRCVRSPVRSPAEHGVAQAWRPDCAVCSAGACSARWRYVDARSQLPYGDSLLLSEMMLRNKSGKTCLNRHKPTAHSQPRSGVLQALQTGSLMQACRHA